MTYKRPPFTWHPDGTKERPGLILLLVGIACFVAGVMIGNLNSERYAVRGLTTAAPIVDSVASGSTDARGAVAPTDKVETVGVQTPPISKPAPERAAAPAPIPPAPSTPAARPIEPAIKRRVQSSNADYLSLRRSILQQ